METFICKSCNVKFDAKGIKVEWMDPSFGPCHKLIAKCPTCNGDCNEYCVPKPNSGSQNIHNHTPTCGSCCGGCGL